MNPLYQRTFDQVRMSEEGIRRVRSELAIRCAQKELEVQTMNSSTKKRRPLAAIAAVCVIAALTVTAFASSGMAERVFHMLSGGTITVGVDENGEGYTGVSLEGGMSAAPVEERGGKLLFVADGSGEEIQCSNETPCIRECIDEAGQRHVFIIGGELGAVGWAECAVDSEGFMSAFVVSLAPEAEGQSTPWLDAGLEQLAQVLGTQVEMEVK